MDTLNIINKLENYNIVQNNLLTLYQKFMFFFPDDYCHLPITDTITDINLEYNHLDKLPINFDKFNHLQILNIGNNKLVNIPKCLYNFDNIEAITFHNNNISQLQNNIGNWKNLKCLSLAHNYYLTHFPETISNWKKLRYLNCSRNRFIYLDHQIDNWKNLEILDMSHNCLSFVHPNISYCRKLKNINLSHNKLKLINGLEQLENLEKLELKHNCLEIISLENLNRLTTLDLSHNKLSHLENVNWNNMTQLEYINLSYNNLETINIDFSVLPNLRTLILDHNNLEHFPDTIFQALNLTTLTIAHNHISNIPQEIGNLVNISLLDVGHNNLDSLPVEMANMTNLEELYINNNHIDILPDELIQCPNLGYCNYTGNQNNEGINITVSNELFQYLNREIFNNHRYNDIIDLDLNQNLQVYNSPQSVHNSSIQSSLKKCIMKLIKDNIKLDIQQVLILVNKDHVLNKGTKKLLNKYCRDHANHHSTLNVTFGQVLTAVWEKITELQMEYQDEVKKIMNDEMDVSRNKCFTGRISRLVSCLHGFIEGIEVNISPNEQISNILLMVKKRLEKENNLTEENWKNEFKNEMEERFYPETKINEWLEHIEI